MDRVGRHPEHDEDVVQKERGEEDQEQAEKEGQVGQNPRQSGMDADQHWAHEQGEEEKTAVIWNAPGRQASAAA